MCPSLDSQNQKTHCFPPIAHTMLHHLVLNVVHDPLIWFDTETQVESKHSITIQEMLVDGIPAPSHCHYICWSRKHTYSISIQVLCSSQCLLANIKYTFLHSAHDSFTGAVLWYKVKSKKPVCTWLLSVKVRTVYIIEAVYLPNVLT